MHRQSAIALTILLSVHFSNISAQDSAVYPPLEGGGKNNLVKVASELEEQFVRRGVLFNDAELQGIVDRVGETVFPQIQDDFIEFRIYLIRDPSPIIFSLAAGQIYIHTGLLARLDNEAQLAAVLAHEAHHVAAHDHIIANNARRRNANISGVMAMGMNNGPGPGGDLGGSWSSNIGHKVRTVFSDAMEINADAGSVGLIGRAGHPPSSALRALDRIREDPELSTPSPLGEFTSRELLTERYGHLQELVDGLPATSSTASTDYVDRPLVLRRVIEMTIDDYIRLDRPGTAADLIESMIRVQPDAHLYAAKGDTHRALGPRPRYEMEQMESRWYMGGKRAELTRDEVFAKWMETEGGSERLAENLEIAEEAYGMSLELDENSSRAHRGLGHINFDEQNYRQAGRHYLKYLKLSPEATDRSFVIEKLQVIKTELKKQKETAE